jgi:hypothetical protein
MKQAESPYPKCPFLCCSGDDAKKYPSKPFLLLLKDIGANERRHPSCLELWKFALPFACKTDGENRCTRDEDIRHAANTVHECDEVHERAS